MGARVTLMDNSINRLRHLDQIFFSRFTNCISSRETIAQEIKNSDLIIGAVLIAGAEAPKLISRVQLSHMTPNSVFVDVAIDQGGCSETSMATSHDNPTFEMNGIVH